MKIHNENLKSEIKAKIYRWILCLINFIDKLPKETSTQIIVSEMLNISGGLSPAIANQLLRSGTSIDANYVESQTASSKKDFTNFIHYSLKSANKSKFWLALLRDAKKVNIKEVNILLEELTEIAKIFGASLLTLKGKRT